MTFSIERFVSASKAVSTSDLDWTALARAGITDDEERVLRYMASTESHAIHYLRDILSGHASRDAELCAFFSCWVYEEFNHGRAIERVLNVCGRKPLVEKSLPTNKPTWRSELEVMFARVLPQLTPHFTALPMAWAALDEMLAASAYTQLSRHTSNRELAKLLLRMAKDERRHHTFFHSQAERRMQHPVARAIARHGLWNMWVPIGIGIGGSGNDFAFLAWLLYDSPRGQEELQHIDRMMTRLPGLEDFDLVYRNVTRRMERFGQRHPEQLMQLRVGRTAAAPRDANLPEENYAEAI